MINEFIKEIESASRANQFGRLESILKKHAVKRKVVKHYGNGLVKAGYYDANGNELVTLTEGA